MKHSYTPSVNIIRDSDKEFPYISTPNAKRSLEQIVDDFRKGIRSFNIIGSYGTGKSSFLLALEQSFAGQKLHFKNNFLVNHKFDSLKLVGKHESLISVFAEELDVKVKTNVAENIFSEIFNRYHDLGKKNPFLLILIDEFGKFLEFAAEHNPEKELYFIQQLAEFINNPKHNILLITTVHQSFESYGFGLSSTQRQEWIKVKGRFKEITFNEPVEQLLFLAAEHMQTKSSGGKQDKKVRDAISLILRSKAFQINSDFGTEIGSKLFPLDLLAANTLTVALQRYGQNERSLFSFLESNDQTSLQKLQGASFYNVANVFEYLNFNFYSFLASRYNPDFSAWSSIRSALDNIERSFEKNLLEYSALVKAIGITNVFAAAGSQLDKQFWISYGKLCLGIENVDELLDELSKKKILLYRNHSKRYILFEGTDLDIQSALLEAANKVDDITDIKTILERHYNLPPILARQHSYITGTPRYFKFVISESPIKEVELADADGLINLIFSEEQTLKSIKDVSLQQKEAVVYGFYRNSKEIKTLLYEIEKSQRVLSENAEDKVAKRELENIIHHQKNLLNHYIINNLFGNRTEVTWVWQGEECRLRNRKAFNVLLSQIATSVYSGAPHFRNELVNRHKLSGAVGTAKKYFFTALVKNWDQDNLGFPEDKFPAEKTIYLTLLKQTGLDSLLSDVTGEVEANPKSNFKKLWKASLAFISSAKEDKKSLQDFIDILSKRPFRLKNGLIEFWVSTFLFLKRDDFALFGKNGFIPDINDQTLELISKNPSDFSIKAFNIEGVKLNIFNSYRLFLNQEQKARLTNNAFIETIKPFLVFYRQLPEYSKNTKRLSNESISLRQAIVNAKDPEKSFFEDFPEALNTSLDDLRADKSVLHQYIETLQNSIRELRTSYENLVDRFEEFIQREIVYENTQFNDYKTSLQTRFKGVKLHLLLPAQKMFVTRINSAIDDRNAWLSSLCSVLLGKNLENIQDSEELVLYDKFKQRVLELDSLAGLSSTHFNEEKEELLGFQLDSFEGVSRSTVRVPKSKMKEVEAIGQKISKSLSSDKTLNIAAMIKILKEQISNE